MNKHSYLTKVFVVLLLVFSFLTQLNAQTPTTFTFTGNGNWNNATNWNNDTVPSSIVPGRDTITIATLPGD